MIDISRNDIETVRLSVQSSGFGLLSGAILPSTLRAMQGEAEESRSAASLAELPGKFNYRAKMTSIGPQARGFLCSKQLTDLLAMIFGGNFILTENRSCLTFYKEGDHLGPHLDKPAEECAVTIIVYVAASGPAYRSARTGLELRVYGQEMTEPCEARITIPTHTGGIVVGRGSKFWHERPRLEKGEEVAAITGCYGYAICADGMASEQAESRNVSTETGAPSEQMTRN